MMSTKRPTLTQQLEEARAEIAAQRKMADTVTEGAARLNEAVPKLWAAVDAVAARCQNVERINLEMREENLQLRRENDRLRMRRGPLGACWDFVMGPPRA
jgi:hypothetical protein